MVAQPPVACQFARLGNDLPCFFIVRHNMAKGQVFVKSPGSDLIIEIFSCSL
jgi:hypothetical protein